MAKLRALTCPNCGASLHWNGTVNVVECRYCQTHVAVESGQRTDRPTEAISIPAPRASRTMLIAIGAGTLAVGGIVAGIAATSRPSSTPAATTTARVSTVSELVATPLAATTEQLARQHRVTAHEHLVIVKVSHPVIEQVDFYWDKARPAHVQQVTLKLRADADTAAIVERARALLGRRLRAASTGGYQFTGGGVTISLSTTIQIMPAVSDPRWQQRLGAAWAVMLHAAFETPMPSRLDAAALRDLLDLGIPLATLGQLAFELDVDAAAAAVKQVAPSVLSDGAAHQLMLDHPWFESATLTWENKANGKWSSLDLYFVPEVAWAAVHDTLVACLAPVVGQPKRIVTDHVAGKFELQYPAKQGRPWIDVGNGVLAIRPHYNFGDPATATGFSDVLTALANCGP